MKFLTSSSGRPLYMATTLLSIAFRKLGLSVHEGMDANALDAVVPGDHTPGQLVLLPEDRKP